MYRSLLFLPGNNPNRLIAAKLPVLDIHELKDKIEGITGKPKSLVKGDRVVAEVIGRNGDLQDRIYNVR